MVRETWTAAGCLQYARCSGELQEDSVPDQLRIVDGARKELGLALLHPAFADEARRGYDEERAGLKALLDFVRAHPRRPEKNSEYVPVLISSTDRFGRFLDPITIFSYLKILHEHGYELFSVSERLRSRGELSSFIQLAVKSDQASEYSANLSYHTMKGMVSKAQRGFWMGGNAPYGFDRVTITSDGKPKYRYRSLPGCRIAKYALDGRFIEHLEPVVKDGKTRAQYLDKTREERVKLMPGDPKRVKAVQLIARLFLGGKGLRAISDTLQARGLPAPDGTRWMKTTIRNILRNPAYMGAVVYGRRSKSIFNLFSVAQGNEVAFDRVEVRRRRFVFRELGDCIVVENAHEPLIPRQQWERIQKLVARKSKSPGGFPSGRGANSPYLLSKLIWCSRCGYHYQGDRERNTGRRRYICGGYKLCGRVTCSAGPIDAEEIEKFVLEHIQAHLLDGGLFHSREELVARLEARLRATEAPDAESPTRAALEEQLSERRRSVDALLELVDVDNRVLVNEKLRALRGEIHALEEQLTSMPNPAVAVLDDPRERAETLAEQALDLRKLIDAGTPAERKRFIRQFVERVEVDKVKAEACVNLIT